MMHCVTADTGRGGRDPAVQHRPCGLSPALVGGRAKDPIVIVIFLWQFSDVDVLVFNCAKTVRLLLYVENG